MIVVLFFAVDFEHVIIALVVATNTTRILLLIAFVTHQDDIPMGTSGLFSDLGW